MDELRIQGDGLRGFDCEVGRLADRLDKLTSAGCPATDVLCFAAYGGFEQAMIVGSLPAGSDRTAHLLSGSDELSTFGVLPL